MATLTEDIDATQKVIRVSGSTPDQGHFRIRIDDELMDVEGFDRKQLDGGYRDPGVDRTRWIVTRGVGGTTQASHSAGDTLKAATSALVSGETLTPPLPFAGEGGGAAEPGTVVEILTGTQTTYAHIYRGDEDPAVDFGGELQPGDLWVQTGGAPPFVQMVRNAANDDWLATPTLAMVLANGYDASASGIENLADPALDQDAATKAYVDATGEASTLATVVAAGNSLNGENGTDKEIVAKDAGVVRAAMSVSKTGAGGFSIKDALGVEVASFTIDEDTLTIGVDDGAQQLTIDTATGLSYFGPIGALAIAPGGEVTITGASFKLTGLPTSAGDAGELWNDAGVVTVA